MDSEFKGTCPDCGCMNLFRARFPIEPSHHGDEFVRCNGCEMIWTVSDIRAGGKLGSIHPHDFRLITAYIDEIASRDGYTAKEINGQKKSLLGMAKKVDDPLHEASIREFDDPANRRGRSLDHFLRYVNGRSQHLKKPD